MFVLCLNIGACDPDDSGRTSSDDSDNGSGGDTDTDADADGGSGDLDIDSDSDSDGDFDCFDKIDICFVLDVSTSMGFVLDELTNEIGDVWQITPYDN